MGRKKKKGASPSHRNENDESSIHTTPSSKSVAPATTARLIDLLSLRLLSSTRLGSTPRALLSRPDAAALDVWADDDVMLIHFAASEIQQAAVSGVAVCRAQIDASTIKSPTTTPKSDSKRSLAPGSIQICASAVDTLLYPDLPPSSLGVDEKGSSDRVAPPRAASTTPSQEPERFSFAHGGGGDQLYTSPDKSDPYRHSPQTTKAQSSSSSSQFVWVVSLASGLGQRLVQHLCRTASRLCIRSPPELSMTNCEGILKRLVLAHCHQRYLAPNQRFQISFKGKPLELTVVAIEGPDEDPLAVDLSQLSLQEETSSEAECLLQATSSCAKRVYQVTYDTVVELTHADDGAEDPIFVSTPSKQWQYVAGLDMVRNQLRSLLLTPLTKPKLFGSLKPPRGVLLHGPSGVGKSCLAQQIAAEFQDDQNVNVTYVNGASLQSQTTIVGQAEAKLSRLFRQSSTKPRLLILDDIHLVCPKRGSSHSGTDRLAATLLVLLDGIGSSSSSSADEDNTDALVVLGITTNPSLLDPALRRPGRLDVEVPVPIPDEASTRAEILQFQCQRVEAKLPSTGLSSEEDWLTLGRLAKGFTGADCMLAVKEAMQSAILRKSRPSTAIVESLNHDVELHREDLVSAIRATKPSAIKSITVEIPQVYWSSIGGMDSVKRELREAIELPLTHGELFTQLHAPPPRGILLYGPPGCSKTLMARALATEGQMNFLAVKGPELLSKWLGESERALASLFRRARMASPCIIFFDEIDAIACKRGSGDSASSGRLLSQLLTELDGVNHTGSSVGNKKQRVVVVGATNRPDLLDNALTRPGRIDRMIYVGVPDAASRARILELSLKDKSCGDNIDVQQLARDEVSQGFSGAEMVAICRDAALFALEESEDMTAEATPQIEMRHLLRAVDGMQRQITPEMLDFYASFRQKGDSIVQ